LYRILASAFLSAWALTNARKAIAAAHRVDEVKKIRAKMEAHLIELRSVVDLFRVLPATQQPT
jgi:hypothetical protein